jgi:hypothetical protein
VTVASEQEPAVQRVVLDSTIDEMVDDSLRPLRGSKEGRRLKRNAVVNLSFSSWGMATAGLVVTDVLPPTYAASVGLFLGVVIALLYGSVYDDSIRKRTLRIFREQFGDGPVACVFEARADALWIEARGVTTIQPWILLQDVAESPRGIELQFRHGMTIIRARAFATGQVRSAFVQRIRERLADSQRQQ